jgi:hypothetical protein
MYSWIWRHLPGDRVTKGLWAAALVLVLVGVLWFWVFPRIEAWLQVDHGTVEPAIPSATPSASPTHTD